MLGWVDFDLWCSTILPSCSASFASFPSAQGRTSNGWNSLNESQPNLSNLAIRAVVPPCIRSWFCSNSYFNVNKRWSSASQHEPASYSLFCVRCRAGIRVMFAAGILIQQKYPRYHEMFQNFFWCALETLDFPEFLTYPPWDNDKKVITLLPKVRSHPADPFDGFTITNHCSPQRILIWHRHPNRSS